MLTSLRFEKCASIIKSRYERQHQDRTKQDKTGLDSTLTGLNSELDWKKHGSLAVEAVQQSVTLARTEEASRLGLDVDSDLDSDLDSDSDSL